jgi:hypothetical protein
MPLRCHQCRGKFGLVRRRRLTFSGYLHFCSKKCLNAHKGQMHRESGEPFDRFQPPTTATSFEGGLVQQLSRIVKGPA